MKTMNKFMKADQNLLIFQNAIEFDYLFFLPKDEYQCNNDSSIDLQLKYINLEKDIIIVYSIGKSKDGIYWYNCIISSDDMNQLIYKYNKKKLTDFRNNKIKFLKSNI